MLIKLLVTLLITLPVYKADVSAPAKAAQLETLGAAIASAATAEDWPLGEKSLAALLITVGYHESAFALHVHEGRCRPWECDGGRARGPWQLHSNRYTRTVWDQLHGVEHSEIQARAAAKMLTLAYWTCVGRKRRDDWVRLTLRGYAGAGCNSPIKGEDSRVAMFMRVKARLQ